MSTEGVTDTAREEELLRHAADVVVELRPDGRLVYVSDSVERILGRTAASLKGLSFLELVIPEDHADSLAQFRKVVETGEDSITQFRVARGDGYRIEFETTARSFVDSEGRQRIVAVCRDVTERSSRRALDRERDAHHRVIAQSGGRPAAIATADGRILFSNRRFREVFGNDIGIDDIRARVSFASRPVMDSAWSRAKRGQSVDSISDEFEYNHEDGSTSWFSLTWENIRSDDENAQLALFWQDITQRKKIDHALRAVAGGISYAETRTLQPMIAMIAEALEMDRLVLGLLDEDQPDRLQILAAWQDGASLELDSMALPGLPDEAVARGESCIHPTALCQLMPAVRERIGHDYNCYAGLPLRRTDGRVIGLVGGYGRKSMRDTGLTRSLLSSFATHAAAAIERQNADEEIRANQDRFDALARHADDLLVEVDTDARITYISQACLSVLGVEPESLIGVRIEELTHPDDLEIAQRAIDQMASGNLRAVTVSRGRHADGSWRWFEARTNSFRASDGSPRGLILARDITERRRGELGRNLLYRVVQRGADLVFVCQPDATLLFANEAATRLLGSLDVDGVEEKPFHTLFTDLDAERLRSEILPNVSPQTPWSGELELLGSRDGTPIATEATIFLFHDAEETASSYLAVTLRDITERRNAEAALGQSELRLSQAQKMEAVGRLAGGIAHDFNNLLTAIIGYSHLVLEELGEGHRSHGDTEEILRAAERAGGLTRQLLAFSRRPVLQPGFVDLNAVVSDIDRMMRRLIGENIRLVTVQDGELRRIVADPGQVEQVIVNLVVNARDAMPHGGRVDVETANFQLLESLQTASGLLESGVYVLLRVSDTGIGMDESVRERIFEPFFTTKQPHEGTGLGLASVYGIVSAAGGQIDVASVPGGGTTFSVYLPAVIATADEAQPEAREGDARGNETILVLEDSDPVRELVKRTLEGAGYSVLAAESATAALRHCSRHAGEIDLLLCDVVLPNSSGPEVARRVVELRPRTRVLFMSGSTDNALSRHGLQPGTTSLVEKPFTPAIVLSKIRSLLDDDPEPLENALIPTDDPSFPVEHSD
jgi:two-component system cell cycle sensor histidine kinase/response regulator CckA